GRGTYNVIVTEIPWLVQKSRLVERIAELINEKKLPLVADVRDESAEDIRLVIGLAEALREWLDHRRDVLVRRSNHRLKQIGHRLEVLGGYLISYLNLDRVI